MRYAVLGTGIVGRTVAARLDSLGHRVVIGTRDPGATLGRAEYSDWQEVHPEVGLAGFAEAARDGEVLVNATGGQVSVAALTEADAAHLDGKILIDIANPLDFSRGFPPGLDPVDDDSLGELLQRTFPGLRVVKTLNTMNCQIMVDPARVAGEHHVFVSGEDADAKKAVRELLHSFGWPEASVIDLGGIETARGTEMLLPVWLRLMSALGHTDFNFHIQGA
ncbi:MULTISPECIES: NADPH-dependent F420 reductase [Streptomyces]|uniref:NADPH-dependent F420 reductase n=1 Tax=Streptomyces TaxID=1883 RepID=UPI0004BD7B9C|nr:MULTISPECIES: NAD(P)-binding domain-containing protein [Streptomyces]KOU25219.1 NADP oxidoreductase [Streptomyces sp. WM6349]KOU84635.1 NADP oxidoreductase [Streptomyces sp. XY593]KOU93552.1 NADP oxidoreductase [Streptomyces sp. XY533]KOV12445.1 NADP oxidoreductase [Streptomyces sp. XY511]KOV43553.1 NADP oxidoreductase [Streptomyces sp. H036]